MGTQRVEVQIQAVAGEDRQASRSEALLEVVDDHVGHSLRTRTQMEHWNDFGDRVNGEPQPQAMSSTAQPSADLIQLHMRQMEGAKGAIVQRGAVRPCPHEPGRDGGLAVTEHARGRG
jgi:hypothetical protein